VSIFYHAVIIYNTGVYSNRRWWWDECRMFSITWLSNLSTL